MWDKGNLGMIGISEIRGDLPLFQGCHCGAVTFLCILWFQLHWQCCNLPRAPKSEPCERACHCSAATCLTQVWRFLPS